MTVTQCNHLSHYSSKMHVEGALPKFLLQRKESVSVSASRSMAGMSHRSLHLHWIGIFTLLLNHEISQARTPVILIFDIVSRSLTPSISVGRGCSYPGDSFPTDHFWAPHCRKGSSFYGPV